jgi:hypothetical protein
VLCLGDVAPLQQDLVLWLAAKDASYVSPADVIREAIVGQRLSVAALID